MPFVGIIFIFLSSVLTGTLITAVFRERNSNYVVKFATGFLSLFVFLLFSVLVALKLDFDLNRLSVLYLGIVSLASMAAVPLLLKEGFKKPVIIVKKENLPYVLVALVIGFVSYVLLAQSFINDDTLEIVTTAVSTNSVYKYSSLTGSEMVNGLPIFNKVYVIPMFYAVICKIFGLNHFFMIFVIVPVTVYVTNILLVGEIADLLPGVRKNPFMIFYLMLLVCGTYLPSFGIPVTAGYAILRQGYSGYAVLYGILVPLVILNIIKKKYIQAVIHLGFILGLFKIDRVLYTLLDLFDSTEKVMSAGKLAALFLIALFVMLIISWRDGKKADLRLVLMPIAFVSYTICILLDRLTRRKERIIYSVAAGFIAFACINFQPYDGSTLLVSYVSELNEVSDCVRTLRSECPDLKIYGLTDTMTYARVCSDNTAVLYGRDYDSTYMLGTDYEVKSELIPDYDKLMKNLHNEFDYLVLENSFEDIVSGLVSEGVNAIIVSLECEIDRVSGAFPEAGFEYKGLYGNLAVYGRY